MQSNKHIRYYQIKNKDKIFDKLFGSFKIIILSLNSKNKTPMSRQLQTIEFIIDNDQLRSDAAYLSAVPAECTYYMANGLVVVHTITMPFYVLKHIDNEKLMAHITAAATNNAESEGLLNHQLNDIIHVLNAVK